MTPCAVTTMQIKLAIKLLSLAGFLPKCAVLGAVAAAHIRWPRMARRDRVRNPVSGVAYTEFAILLSQRRRTSVTLRPGLGTVT